MSTAKFVHLPAKSGRDNIIVINEGRVAEQGRHEDLMAQEGLYHGLYKIQEFGDPVS